MRGSVAGGACGACGEASGGFLCLPFDPPLPFFSSPPLQLLSQFLLHKLLPFIVPMPVSACAPGMLRRRGHVEPSAAAVPHDRAPFP